MTDIYCTNQKIKVTQYLIKKIKVTQYLITIDKYYVTGIQYLITIDKYYVTGITKKMSL